MTNPQQPPTLGDLCDELVNAVEAQEAAQKDYLTAIKERDEASRRHATAATVLAQATKFSGTKVVVHRGRAILFQTGYNPRVIEMEVP